MNNEWTPFRDDDNNTEPIGATPPADGSASASAPTSQPAPDHAPAASPAPGAGPAEAWGQPEQTRVLPPAAALAGTAYDAPAAPKRRAGTLSAAVLAGALVLGGAAGVGGAAAYDAFDGDGSSNTTGSGGDLTSSSSASNAAAVSGGVSGVAAKVLPSVVQVNVTGSNGAGTGSGIVLTEDGTILTNDHVATAVEGGKLSVRFNNGDVADAKLVGTDPVTDLAVIKAEGVSGLTPANLGKSGDLKIGEQVVAIGSPEGLSATVTSGIVSALNRAVSISGDSSDSNPFGGGGESQGSSQTTTYPAIQTDAPINQGNSGGALVNMAGQVVGINSAIKTAQGSSGSIGIGFAIPMDEALPIINQLRAGETPTHARLGISVSDSANSQGTSGGAVIKSVEKGDAGDDAGLKAGDVVTKIDDKLIESADDLVATVRGQRPGEEVTLTILRDGKEQTVDAKLGSDENATAS